MNKNEYKEKQKKNCENVKRRACAVGQLDKASRHGRMNVMGLVKASESAWRRH